MRRVADGHRVGAADIAGDIRVGGSPQVAGREVSLGEVAGHRFGRVADQAGDELSQVIASRLSRAAVTSAIKL